MQSLATTLKDGKYTAIATQPSSLKNPTGASFPVTFTVNTQPPKVSLEQIPTPTSDAAPVFSGSATDPKEKVIVHVYAGHSAAGTPVASAEAEVFEEKWVTDAE